MINNSIDTKAYILLLENEEYELRMTLNESFIEFKLEPKNTVSDYYYYEKCDLSTINAEKYFIMPLNDLKKAFEKFDKRLKNKNAKLIKASEDTINLNFKIIIDDEELETNLKLKKFKINKEVAYNNLLNKFNEMKEKIKELEKNLNETKKEMNTKIDIMYEDFLKKKQEKEEKQKKEELIRQEEEKKLKLNDNVNLLNDYQSQNIDINEFYTLSNDKLENKRNTIAVYPIIRNNERLYELACAKEDSRNYYHIALYNILSKKKQM